MKSLTPFGVTVPFYVSRLETAKPFDPEVALMYAWEQMNTIGYNSPAVEIVTRLFEEIERTSLPVSWWLWNVNQRIFKQISATIQWTATSVGRNAFETLLSQGATTTEDVRLFMEENSYSSIVNLVVHECGPECQELRFNSLFGWVAGCNPSGQNERHKRVVYETLLWQLSPAGVSFREKALDENQKRLREQTR